MERKSLSGVLFDLDGTLLDTAPDLVYACNAAALEAGLQPQDLKALRPMVSNGASAMLQLMLEGQETDVDFDSLLDRMLSLYQDHIAVHTRFLTAWTVCWTNWKTVV